MIQPTKLMHSAIEQYGLANRAYQYDENVRGVVVYLVNYDHLNIPTGMSKIATWFGEDRRPPLAQLEFNFF